MCMLHSASSDVFSVSIVANFSASPIPLQRFPNTFVFNFSRFFPFMHRPRANSSPCCSLSRALIIVMSKNPTVHDDAAPRRATASSSGSSVKAEECHSDAFQALLAACLFPCAINIQDGSDVPSNEKKVEVEEEEESSVAVAGGDGVFFLRTQYLHPIAIARHLWLETMIRRAGSCTMPPAIEFKSLKVTSQLLLQQRQALKIHTFIRRTATSMFSFLASTPMPSTEPTGSCKSTSAKR